MTSETFSKPQLHPPLDPACDGSPRNWVVWAGPEDDHILVCTSDAIATAKDMRRDPASLSLPGPVRSSGVGQLCQPCSAAQIVQFGCCNGGQSDERVADHIGG